MRKKIIVFLLFAAAFICLLIAVFYAQKYHKGNQEYEDIKKAAVTDKDTAEDDDGQQAKEQRIVVDWDSMISKNSDYVGWIEMESGASYPVVQARDNNYYLHTGLYREYNINGCIFMDCNADSGWNSRNTIVYGHNMNNGSMFGSNKKYNNEEYARENPYFYIHVKGGYNVYRIYTYILTDDVTYPYIAELVTDEDMEEYIRKTKEMSVYWIDEASPQPSDRIVTLSTCIGQTGGIHRQLIQGKFEKFVKYQDSDGKGGNAG